MTEFEQHSHQPQADMVAGLVQLLIT